MPVQPLEQVSFGGVDSRSNPLNMPNDRLLRCLNWVPKQAGYLEQRWGYSTVSMSPVTVAAGVAIIPFRLWNGTKYVLLFQGTNWNLFAVATGTVSAPTIRGAAIGAVARGNSYVFGNRLHYGNGADQKFFDGTQWRDNGMRAPTSTEANTVSVVIGSADTVTGLPTASLTGFQFYMAFWNPTTGHVGNRVAIGSRIANTTQVDINFTVLPQMSTVGGNNAAGDSEWQIVFGRTGDGAQVPYVVVDSSNNWIAAPNTATTFTLTPLNIDGNFELPTRNGIIPAAQTMFATVGDNIYSCDLGSPTVRISGSQLDSNAGRFMGRPEQSWAGNDIETFPTGEAVTGLFEVNLEAFVGTLTDCAVLTDLAGVRTWRGPWALGIAGMRAGCKTHHGFFWVSGDKQLCTFVNGLPVAISEEYEAAELAQLGDAFLTIIECRYVRRPDLNKDEIRIEGQKADGTPYTVIHDFKLMDQRSPYGQGYSSQFQGPLGTVYASAVVRDANSKTQVFAIATTGQLYQLYTGADDVGNQFTSDAIGLINTGPGRPTLESIDWYGDANVDVQIGRTLQTSLALDATGSNFEDLTPSGSSEIPQGYELDFRFRAKNPTTEVHHTYLRLLLTSHSADGSLSLNSPAHTPLENYGRVYAVIPAVGEERGY